MRKSSLAALLLLLCLPHVLAGSEKKQPKDYALIYGTVFGPNDAPIEGVRILIRKVDEKKPKYGPDFRHSR